MPRSIFSRLFGAMTIFATMASAVGQAFECDYEDQCCYEACDACIDRFWVEADYLYWKVQDSPTVIPLVILQPVADGPFDVVLGGKKIKNDWHSGGRFAVGYWLDECKNIGAEASFFFLGNHSKRSSVASDIEGSPRLRVPFFDVTTGLPDSTALATPGLFRGSASLKTSNRMLGAEFNLVHEWAETDGFRVLAGFRYWNFNEKLTFSTNSPLVIVPTIYNNEDKFRTQNNFYGGQIGACFTRSFNAFVLDIKGKVALGAMYQKSTISGRFITNEFTGAVEVFEGGYFALPTNIGKHRKTKFSVIPELNINLGYQVTNSLRVHVGYSILYATEVLRASKQMSSAINPTQSANIEFTPIPVLIGAPLPTGKPRSSGLWTQGVNAGLEFTF